MCFEFYICTNKSANKMDSWSYFLLKNDILLKRICLWHWFQGFILFVSRWDKSYDNNAFSYRIEMTTNGTSSILITSRFLNHQRKMYAAKYKTRRPVLWWIYLLKTRQNEQYGPYALFGVLNPHFLRKSKYEVK